MPLTDVACRTAKATGKPRKLADEKGLYLLVNQTGKYWRWDYRYLGKRKTMAFGVYPETSLFTARAKRDEQRIRLGSGADPMEERRAAKLSRYIAAGNSFKVIAEEWHTARKPRWAKVTAEKILTHLTADIFPEIGHLPIAEVTAPKLLDALKKVERRGAAYTATRLREICGQIFRFGIATGRATYNPAADLKGALVTPLAKHRPAITTPREFGAFLRALRDYGGADRLTLAATRLALLTFVRSQELRLAVWNEIDLDGCEWRIPAHRMKTGKGLNQAHVVPLSRQAVEELQRIRSLVPEATYVFPNTYGSDGYMSENTIGRMLIRMGYQGKQTLHGFRASARSILSERGWTAEALERQLDHAEGNKVVAAYARGEYLDERRRIMADWGAIVEALEAGQALPARAKVPGTEGVLS